MYAFGQHAVVQLGDFFFHALKHNAWIFAFAHDDDACHHIVVQILADCAQPGQCANGDSSNVAYQYRRAVFAGHHNPANVVRRAQQADTANSVLLRALSYVAATRIRVAAPQRVEQVLKGELVSPQFVQIRLHLVLLDKASHGHHVRYAGHLPQRAFNDPVFQGSQLGGGCAIAADAIAHDFANRRGVGCDVGLNAWRQVDTAQSFADLRANLQHVSLVVISDDCERQTKLRVRENANRIRQAGQRDFNWQRDLFFHLFRRAAGV